MFGLQAGQQAVDAAGVDVAGLLDQGVQRGLQRGRVRPGRHIAQGQQQGRLVAIAEEALRRGMSVVVSDIREEALAAAAQKLEGQGANVLAVLADVTSEENILALRDKAPLDKLEQQALEVLSAKGWMQRASPCRARSASKVSSAA
mgnify:CR=1 FL=1